MADRQDAHEGFAWRHAVGPFSDEAVGIAFRAMFLSLGTALSAYDGASHGPSLAEDRKPQTEPD